MADTGIKGYFIPTLPYEMEGLKVTGVLDQLAQGLLDLVDPQVLYLRPHPSTAAQLADPDQEVY